MSTRPEKPWKPSPELLAAYGDGELDGDEGAAELRQRIEIYVNTDPRARDELRQSQRMKQLWEKTTPKEPNAKAWREVLESIDSRSGTASQGPVSSGSASSGRAAASLILLAACVAWAVLLPGAFQAPSVVDMEVLPVAEACEIEILHINGEDTPSLVVGTLPVQEPLELAEAGEIQFTRVQPAKLDRMVPTVHVGGGRPMIWARLEAED